MVDLGGKSAGFESNGANMVDSAGNNAGVDEVVVDLSDEIDLGVKNDMVDLSGGSHDAGI